jgi:hypothetical protein
MEKRMILVTEANFRTMLCVIRNLKENMKDIEIFALGTSKSYGMVSRYVSKKIVVCKEDYYPTMEKFIKEYYNNIMVFPHLEETYLRLYSKNISNIIAPPKEIAYKVTKKEEVIDFISNSFPEILPESILISSDNIDKILGDIIHFTENHGKAILKITTEIGKDYGPYNRFVVLEKDNLYGNIDKIVNFLKRNINSSFILQKYVDGIGIGIGGLWYEGEALCIGGHRRLLQSHGKEGISLIAESYIEKSALSYSLDIMKELKYTGIALVEFRLDYNGNVWFMEINPRVWGTIGLYIESGLDIPYIAYKLYKYGEIEKIPISKFKEGKKIFFLKDYLMSAYRNSKSDFIKALISSMYMLMKYKEGSLDVKDPLPFFYDIASIIKSGFKKI